MNTTEEKLKLIGKEIEEFKRVVRKFTNWDSTFPILDFINPREAFVYGKLIGKRELLQEEK
jgi:hypothetical protein